MCGSEARSWCLQNHDVTRFGTPTLLTPVTAIFGKLLSCCQNHFAQGKGENPVLVWIWWHCPTQLCGSTMTEDSASHKIFTIQLNPHPTQFCIETTECFNLAFTAFLPSPAGHRAKKQKIGQIYHGQRDFLRCGEFCKGNWDWERKKDREDSEGCRTRLIMQAGSGTDLTGCWQLLHSAH